MVPSWGGSAPRGHWAMSGDVCGHHTGGAAGIKWVGGSCCSGLPVPGAAPVSAGGDPARDGMENQPRLDAHTGGLLPSLSPG